MVEDVIPLNHDPGRWEEPPEHKKFSTGVEDFALSICI
jgi:hypothetical protein